MKETPFTRSIEKVIELKIRAVEAYIEEIVEPLADIGNPEKLIKKPYEEWTELDRQLLFRVYGEELNKYVFKKEYPKLKELEKEEI